MPKLSVVIPYRDRLTHLESILPELKRCLINIEHEIIVVEQEQGEVFNRGYLKNIGFSHSENCDYVCFHDVDMIPDKIEFDYSYSEGATHLAKKVSQFDYEIPYTHFFGGVLLVDKESFKKVNGYSNEFWGWGAEDDDLYNRFKYFSVNTSSRDCKFISFDHDRDKIDPQKNWDYRDSCRQNPEVYKKDGLSSMNPTIIKIENNQLNSVNFKLIKVSLAIITIIEGAGGVSASFNSNGA